MPPPLVAYFGPDLDDPAVRRRVAQWRHAGFDVVALAFSRQPQEPSAGSDMLSLGRVAPQSRLRRIIPLAAAALRLGRLRKRLRAADIFVARNLDNAMLALFARWMAHSPAPLVYEVLDVNPSCTMPGWQAAVLRRLEKWLLGRTDLLVVSSPHFIAAYYEPVLHYRGNWLLFENKVPRYAQIQQLSLPVAGRDERRHVDAPPAKRRWRIGWFGYLDDQQSWDILRRVAQEMPDHVSLYVRGRPYPNFDMDRFLADVARLDNVRYDGPFRNPDDLAAIYGAVDITWSVDLNAPAGNSKWLLTNGIYEAGYFGKPVIGQAGTAVGEFLETYDSGWCLAAPLDEQLIALVRGLTTAQYDAKCRTVAALRMDRFVETNEIRMIWDQLQGRCARHRPAAAAPFQAQSLS